MGKWLNVAAGKTEPKPGKPPLSKTTKRAESAPQTELLHGNILAAMRKSQPEGWGWWGYLLSDGGRGSIRGPYPDRQSAIIALQVQFPGQEVVGLNPLPGSLPKPAPRLERIEIGRCKPPIITCEICRHWTADKQNPLGGMGKCGRGFKAMAFPWHKCRGEK